jgi:hypothetical protein
MLKVLLNYSMTYASCWFGCSSIMLEGVLTTKLYLCLFDNVMFPHDLFKIDIYPFALLCSYIIEDNHRFLIIEANAGYILCFWQQFCLRIEGSDSKRATQFSLRLHHYPVNKTARVCCVWTRGIWLRERQPSKELINVENIVVSTEDQSSCLLATSSDFQVSKK